MNPTSEEHDVSPRGRALGLVWGARFRRRGRAVEGDVVASADRLDVRRVSAFDLAAGAAPVTLLDEHYRSAPHLIGFSAHRFYDDRLRIATRHPSNDRATAIDVRRLDGDRDRGVNRAEVEAAIRGNLRIGSTW